MSEIRSPLRHWLVSGELPRPQSAAAADALVVGAVEQGLAGLLHRAVVAEGAPWPIAAAERLRDLRRSLLVRGTRQLAAAARTQELLERHGLRAVALKGAAFAERLYDSPADRPMADVDLLALDDWRASVEVLRRGGLREEERADHAWSWRDPASGTLIELHHGLTSCPGLFPWDPEVLWRRRRTLEGLLVQASLHAAFQHGLVLSLVQYLDFRRLFENACLDVGTLLEIARGWRAEVALAAALEAAVVVVAAPVPEELRVRLRATLPRRLAGWLAEILEDPLSLVTPSRPSLARARWLLATGRRLALVRETLAPSRPGEAAAPFLRRALRSARRAGALTRRWALPTL